ncbi:MAG: CDP-alcohol phosphatidyltransferase family protein [Nanoarchaeota archaeon]
MLELVTVKELRETTLHADEDQAYLSFKIIRWFGLYIAKVLIPFPITPTQVTLIGLFVGLIGIPLLWFGNYWYSLIGIMAYHFHWIIDATDGVIARHKKQGSISGGFMDSIAHRIIQPLLLVSFGIGGYFRYDGIVDVFGFFSFDHIWFLWAGISASIFFLLHYLVDMKKYEVILMETKFPDKKTLDLLRGGLHGYETRKGIKSLLFNFLRINPFMIIFFAAIFGFLQWLIVFYSIVYPLLFIKAVINKYKYFRTL